MRKRPAPGASLRMPKPAKPADARARLAELFGGAPDRPNALSDLPDWPKIQSLLQGLADQSPFLWGLIRRDPARLLRALKKPPDEALDAALQRLDACAAADCSEAQVMSLLRSAKQETALIVALADLAGRHDVAAATRALSRAADCLVAAALRAALRLAGDKLALPAVDRPEQDCGLVVLALGKHGAMELNYSSDVDLVVFYDQHAPALNAGPGAKPNALKLTRHLVKLLQERTGEGYVLRVDLRLRPDPGSTAPAVSLDAARHYYETLGQNWERAAMIKARPVAGDLALGFSFLAEMTSFIWRKYFDYAAIADIHAMKRQIHAAKGHAEITVAGHDLKLGRGGIREIEFFVQTQQLIFGGRRPLLRGPRTLDMLAQLLAGRLDHARRGERTRRRLCVPARGGAPAANAARPADPAPAGGARRPEGFRAILRLWRAGGLFRRPAAPFAGGGETLRPAVRACAGS